MTLTYHDIIGDDPHPYLKYFDRDIIQRASCIEQQRLLAERFQELTLQMEAAQKEGNFSHCASLTNEIANDPRRTKIMNRLKEKQAKKLSANKAQ